MRNPHSPSTYGLATNSLLDANKSDTYKPFTEALTGSIFENHPYKFSRAQLKNYFQRIGITGNEIFEVSLDNLSRIHRQQVVSVHIGNYAMQDKSKKKLATPISLEIENIYKKIVLDGNHGYCFENNLLLGYVLFSLGYNTSIFNAHIIRNEKPWADPQHIILLVSINGTELIGDAGYGGVAPIPVTQFTCDEVQIGPVHHWHTTDEKPNQYKLERTEANGLAVSNEGWYKLSHQYHVPGSEECFWKPLYQFERRDCTWQEVLDSNFRTSLNKDTSPFIGRIFETGFDGKGGRMSLTHEQLVVTLHGKKTLSTPVTSGEDYKNKLRDHFNHEEAGAIRKRVKFAKTSP